ncbi:ORF6N domain-containing protein [Sinomicrobium weinanense]|uniref:ORF6N domain-containing protein n=1 Tax=Sinomicrobium weinanense TaxID=2842200 RepID=A0A926JQE8_9FLAO|nr:ORF6N domain-containing protein [Sinomicrobium weinanense]MBC9795469.1 ORF6N domain-containing protein [Sinomicrobium weinanense]MBU3123994.1 ORF6N domain-containing protein [Sinomicrobium weinanense]
MSKEQELSIPDEVVIGKIYFIRDQKVMLDRDLAALYGVETRVLKQAVKRNMKRFPEDFMFKMTKAEFESWRSQFVTSKADQKGLRYAPFCFTEQGVTMLSCILNSDRAIAVNIRIIRVFTKLRQNLTDTLSLKLEIEEIKKKLSNQSKNIGLVFSYLDELMEKKENATFRPRVGFKAGRD